VFQETDGDRFFGREKQIEQLWDKFRSLHEGDSTIRVLPIYGPSGSRKSSLARAGLIPEFARRPLPGYAQARVAALVPRTHPLEALASVLPRVATNDLTPVAKTREFAEELEKVNKQGNLEISLVFSAGTTVSAGWVEDGVFIVNTNLSVNVAITESAGHGQSIFEYAPKTKGASAFKALAGPGWHRCLANQVASPLVCDWAIALGDEVERPQFIHSQMTLKQRGKQRLLLAYFDNHSHN
jgi:hypothetical protein